MRVLSVDPGYDKLGVAILEKEEREKERLIFSECYSPPRELSQEERILSIGKKINSLIDEFKPDCLVLEKIFFNKNQKTAMAVSETRGAIIYQSKILGLEIYQYTPLQIKMAVTSYGRSGKNEVAKMVGKIINIDDKKIRTDDEYDAIAVGLTFFAYLKSGLPKVVHS